MKGFRMVLFFLTFFIVYGLLNYYIFIRGWQAIGGIHFSSLKITFIALFVFFNFSYFIARMAGKILPSGVTDFFAFTGGMWFAAMLYFILLIVSFDLLRFAGNSLSFFPESVKTIGRP